MAPYLFIPALWLVGLLMLQCCMHVLMIIVSFLYHRNYKEHLTSDSNDISSVHHLLESAIDLQDQAQVKLHSLQAPDARNRVYADNINPNSNRYRSMWQAACAAVMARVAEERRLRAEWQK